ncbi:transcriptional regulator [Canicola haemoglobinophilus]|uniref:Transcriptional regulator n=1 Tax=Canicola haemoglobinophilus TaxID=733 RepID=A0AB38HAB4_9PAST|nr:helix-turn-helix transcriptional regulator [Canicola haemoglobinophilus]MBN6710397.1 helix-turn-helix transcriptional regulator [Canicola haemoglobinophilus]STO55232.1 transcriptional regulator [Canicola haemoglobinophilus]STO69198.1 transcriptional regulator [Canicola haemoglobinophilus]
MKTNEKIRQLRESRQWTQEDMANKLSMSTQGYAKIERGDTRSNLDRLEQISEVFGIDVVELLAYGEDAQINFNNSANNSTFTNSCFSFASGDLELEIQRLQLMLSHKDELIENLKRENKLLIEMNELLKNK